MKLFKYVAQASCLCIIFRGTQAKRLCYILCAFLVAGCVTSEQSKSVTLSEGFDESAGNVPCYIVSTPSATYYLEKQGGGLSSMLDIDGVDWLGFHPETGSGSAGEYRGFPNAIFRQDGNYFHALNSTTNVSTSVVELDSDSHVRIVITSGNGLWKSRWDFYPDRCDFTMIEISTGYKYWVLYEGVPGGTLDKSDFWLSSASAEKNSIDRRLDRDLPGPEWIAFGDENSPRMIYILNHWDDSHLDVFYNMRDEMTVFGFGRVGIDSFLDSMQTFSIGFTETQEYESISDKIDSLVNLRLPSQ